MGNETNSGLEQNNESGKMKKSFICNIVDNYRNLEKSIVNKLALYNSSHGTTTGSSREDIWKELFEIIIPKKFVIEHSVFIIDSEGNISKEVDLAIVDNMYTPYIFSYGNVKFVPIEAVAAVVECKSETAVIDKWSDSIDNLKTSQNSIVRMATGIMVNGKQISSSKDLKPTKTSAPTQTSAPISTQTSTRPIKIFCGYNTELKIEKIMEKFDFYVCANFEKQNIDVRIKNENLACLYKKLNHHKTKNKIKEWDGAGADIKIEDYAVKCGDADVSLLTLNFQLNQILMLINNPIPFPHLAYVKMFNDSYKKLI